MSGYIKLHRKITDSYIWDCPLRYKLWSALLFKANHKTKKFIFHGKPMIVKPGQFITGRNSLADYARLNPSTVQKYLKEFEKEGMIEQLCNRSNRLITIKKWKDYQQSVTTDNFPDNTNKNVKNEKNKEYIHRTKTTFSPPSVQTLEKYIKDNNIQVDPLQFISYYQANGWKVGKNPMKNWKAAVRTWHLKNVKSNGTMESRLRPL